MSGRGTLVEPSALSAVLFDLDGTLIDSIDLILRSYEHTLRAHKKRERSREELLVGLGTPLAAQLGPLASDAEELDAMIATYRAWNLDHHDEMVAPFPGAVDATRSLADRGLTLGLVTSKARSVALRGLAVCGFDVDLAVVIGSDDVTVHKPHPAPVTAALGRLAVAPGRAIYVGDSPHDMTAGSAAGTRTAAALWGPFAREALAPCRPDVWLTEPSEMAELG